MLQEPHAIRLSAVGASRSGCARKKTSSSWQRCMLRDWHSATFFPLSKRALTATGTEKSLRYAYRYAPCSQYLQAVPTSISEGSADVMASRKTRDSLSRRRGSRPTTSHFGQNCLARFVVNGWQFGLHEWSALAPLPARAPEGLASGLQRFKEQHAVPYPSTEEWHGAWVASEAYNGDGNLIDLSPAPTTQGSAVNNIDTRVLPAASAKAPTALLALSESDVAAWKRVSLAKSCPSVTGWVSAPPLLVRPAEKRRSQPIL